MLANIDFILSLLDEQTGVSQGGGFGFSDMALFRFDRAFQFM